MFVKFCLSYPPRIFRFVIMALVAVSAALGATVAGGHTPSAFALQMQPTTDWSFYVTAYDDNQMAALGCNQGHFDAGHSPPINSLVVLDFGVQNSSGSGTIATFGGAPFTNAKVEEMAEVFSSNYYNCTGPGDPTSILTLGIGTNNSVIYSDSTYTALGKDWANVVSAVIASNKTTGIQNQVTIWGASDLEDWIDRNKNIIIPADQTTAWVNGYSSLDPAAYVNYGSANGCPTSGYANLACDSFDGVTYHQYDYWGTARAEWVKSGQDGWRLKPRLRDARMRVLQPATAGFVAERGEAAQARF